MPRPVGRRKLERPDTPWRRDERAALRKLVPGYEKLRCDLRAEMGRLEGADCGRLSTVLETHQVPAGALRIRVLNSIPRLTRLRYYCATLGLPSPRVDARKGA